MAGTQKLIDMAGQAANKGLWALREYYKALRTDERRSIERVVMDELVPIATAIDEKRNMQPRITAELASRELADQDEARA